MLKSDHGAQAFVRMTSTLLRSLMAPVCRSHWCVAYHGTDFTAAMNILVEGFRRPSMGIQKNPYEPSPMVPYTVLDIGGHQRVLATLVVWIHFCHNGERVVRPV